MFFAVTWNIGKQSSKTDFAPPTIIVNVPSIAPFSPPLTGASRTRTPFALATSATFFDVTGDIVLISIYVEPDLLPSKMPPAPKAAFSTSGESGSIVMTRSAQAATSFDERALSTHRFQFFNRRIHNIEDR